MEFRDGIYTHDLEETHSQYVSLVFEDREGIDEAHIDEGDKESGELWWSLDEQEEIRTFLLKINPGTKIKVFTNLATKLLTVILNIIQDEPIVRNVITQSEDGMDIYRIDYTNIITLIHEESEEIIKIEYLKEIETIDFEIDEEAQYFETSNIKEIIREDIVLKSSMEIIYEEIEQKESLISYFISELPSHKRNNTLELNLIYKLVNNIINLVKDFQTIDVTGQAILSKKGPFYNKIKHNFNITNMDIPWLYPIINEKKKLYTDISAGKYFEDPDLPDLGSLSQELEEELYAETNDYIKVSLEEELEKEINIYEKYTSEFGEINSLDEYYKLLYEGTNNYEGDILLPVRRGEVPNNTHTDLLNIGILQHSLQVLRNPENQTGIKFEGKAKTGIITNNERLNFRRAEGTSYVLKDNLAPGETKIKTSCNGTGKNSSRLYSLDENFNIKINSPPSEVNFISGETLNISGYLIDTSNLERIKLNFLEKIIVNNDNYIINSQRGTPSLLDYMRQHLKDINKPTNDEQILSNILQIDWNKTENLSFKNNYMIKFNFDEDVDSIDKNKEILGYISPNTNNIYYSLDKKSLQKIYNISELNSLLSPFHLHINDFTLNNYMKLGMNNIIYNNIDKLFERNNNIHKQWIYEKNKYHLFQEIDLKAINICLHSLNEHKNEEEIYAKLNYYYKIKFKNQKIKLLKNYCFVHHNIKENKHLDFNGLLDLVTNYFIVRNKLYSFKESFYLPIISSSNNPLSHSKILGLDKQELNTYLLDILNIYNIEASVIVKNNNLSDLQNMILKISHTIKNHSLGNELFLNFINYIYSLLLINRVVKDIENFSLKEWYELNKDDENNEIINSFKENDLGLDAMYEYLDMDHNFKEFITTTIDSEELLGKKESTYLERIEELKRIHGTNEFFMNNCFNYSIVKVYKDFDSLKEDNHKENVKYDRQFDFILEDSKKLRDIMSQTENSSKSNHEIINILVNKLELKYYNLKRDEILSISNKVYKKVEENRTTGKEIVSTVDNGNYCILILENQKILFKRINQVWVQVKDITGREEDCERQTVEDLNEFLETKLKSSIDNDRTDNMCVYDFIKNKCSSRKLILLAQNIDYLYSSYKVLKSLISKSNSFSRNIEKCKKKLESSILKYHKHNYNIVNRKKREQYHHDKISNLGKSITKIPIKNEFLDLLKNAFSIMKKDSDLGYSKIKQLINSYGDIRTDEYGIITGIYWDKQCIDTEISKQDVEAPKMLCIHWLDVAELAWLSSDNKLEEIKKIIEKYGVINEDTHHCKICGEQFQDIQLSGLEGFTRDSKPLIFREEVEVVDNSYENELHQLNNSLNSFRHEINEVISEITSRGFGIKITMSDRMEIIERVCKFYYQLPRYDFGENSYEKQAFIDFLKSIKKKYKDKKIRQLLFAWLKNLVGESNLNKASSKVYKFSLDISSVSQFENKKVSIFWLGKQRYLEIFLKVHLQSMENIWKQIIRVRKNIEKELYKLPTKDTSYSSLENLLSDLEKTKQLPNIVYYIYHTLTHLKTNYEKFTKKQLLFMILNMTYYHLIAEDYQIGDLEDTRTERIIVLEKNIIDFELLEDFRDFWIKTITITHKKNTGLWRSLSGKFQNNIEDIQNIRDEYSLESESYIQGLLKKRENLKQLKLEKTILFLESQETFWKSFRPYFNYNTVPYSEDINSIISRRNTLLRSVSTDVTETLGTLDNKIKQASFYKSLELIRNFNISINADPDKKYQICCHNLLGNKYLKYFTDKDDTLLDKFEYLLKLDSIINNIDTGKKVSNYFPENRINRDFYTYFVIDNEPKTLEEYTNKIYELEKSYNLKTGEKKILDIFLDYDQDLVSKIYSNLEGTVNDEDITQDMMKEELKKLIQERYGFDDDALLDVFFNNQLDNKINVLLENNDLLVNTKKGIFNIISKKELELLLEGRDLAFVKQKYNDFYNLIKKKLLFIESDMSLFYSKKNVSSESILNNKNNKIVTLLRELKSNLVMKPYDISDKINDIIDMFEEGEFTDESVLWSRINTVKLEIIQYLSDKCIDLGIDNSFIGILSDYNLDQYNTKLMNGKKHEILEELKVEGISADLIENEKSKRILKYSNEVQEILNIIIKKYNHRLIKSIGLLKSFSTDKNIFKFYKRSQLASWSSSKRMAEYELQKKDHYYEYYNYSKNLINLSLDAEDAPILSNIQEILNINDFTECISELNAQLLPGTHTFKLEFLNILFSSLFYLNIMNILEQFDDEESQKLILHYLNNEVFYKINVENQWDILSQNDINNYLKKKKARANASRKSRFESKSDELKKTHKLMRSFNIGKLLKKNDMEEDMLEKETEYQTGDIMSEEKTQTALEEFTPEELELFRNQQEFELEETFEMDLGNVLGEDAADEYDGW